MYRQVSFVSRWALLMAAGVILSGAQHDDRGGRSASAPDSPAIPLGQSDPAAPTGESRQSAPLLADGTVPLTGTLLHDSGAYGSVPLRFDINDPQYPADWSCYQNQLDNQATLGDAWRAHDPIFGWGYNVGPTGGKQTDDEAQWLLGMEAGYVADYMGDDLIDDTDIWFEFYLQRTDAANLYYQRPIEVFCEATRDTTPKALLHFYQYYTSWIFSQTGTTAMLLHPAAGYLSLGGDSVGVSLRVAKNDINAVEQVDSDGVAVPLLKLNAANELEVGSAARATVVPGDLGVTGTITGTLSGKTALRRDVLASSAALTLNTTESSYFQVRALNTNTTVHSVGSPIVGDRILLEISATGAARFVSFDAAEFQAVNRAVPGAHTCVFQFVFNGDVFVQSNVPIDTLTH
ncbi:hypothetical protein RAS1_16220 [Phycisphaerae bacterium RAS1]|nr:hypothetical protein RAS1_16220 [Phycisphaerae bacterium RAS1]